MKNSMKALSDAVGGGDPTDPMKKKKKEAPKSKGNRAAMKKAKETGVYQGQNKDVKNRGRKSTVKPPKY